MRRRVAVVVGTLLTVAVVGMAAPAQARGCQAFGTGLAVDGSSSLLGRYLSQITPVDGLIHGFHSQVC